MATKYKRRDPWAEIHHYRNEAAGARNEVKRLTQELEASRQREAEARDKALEEVADKIDDGWPFVGIMSIGCQALLTNEIRALKSNHESKDTQGGT